MNPGITIAAVLMLSASAAAAAPPAPPEALIARALSAAPPAVAAGAAVMTIDAAGRMAALRSGANGWTCLPYDVGTPTESPLCLDRNGLAWLEAVMAGRTPDPAAVGLSYMLQGGSVWSNLHGDATRPEPGQTAGLAIPPHVMVLSAAVAAASGYPSGQVSPDTSRPFVLLGGTPQAVVILPVGGWPPRLPSQAP